MGDIQSYGGATSARSVMNPVFASSIILDGLAAMHHPDNTLHWGRLVDAKTDHLGLAMAWLRRAHDATSGNGISAGYSFHKGWDPAYVETTGYIIETMLDYGRRQPGQGWEHRARSLVDWEVTMQLPGGGFQAGYGVAATPVVFNTGMVLFGLLKAFEAFEDNKYLESAMKAGDWLVKVQSESGAWTAPHAFSNRPHSYHARVSWALLELARASNEEKYTRAARKNLEWVLRNKLDNNWYKFSNFEKGGQSFTHTIAYTIRGLLESGLLLDEPRYIHAARSSAIEIAAAILRDNGYFHGAYKRDWSGSRYSCLTGNAQLAIIWKKLNALKSNHVLVMLAGAATDTLKAIQQHWHATGKLFGGRFVNVSGAIPGSFPLWGSYQSFHFPNWAVKFFADLLMMAS